MGIIRDKKEWDEENFDICSVCGGYKAKLQPGGCTCTIKITVSFGTPEDAEKLYWAFHSGELNHLGIIKVEYLND